MKKYPSDEKKYVCDLCESKFKTKCDLKRHKMFVHEIGVVWENCDLCESKCKTKSNLKSHKLKKHNIGLEWKNCDLCESKFKTKGEFQKHKMHIHEIGLEWKSCDLCEVKCKTKGNLKMHKAFLHNIGRFGCDSETCKKRFHTKYFLEKHFKNYHDRGNEVCVSCNERVFKLHCYYYEKGKTCKICRRCYKEKTGKDSRIEHILSDYLDTFIDKEFILTEDSKVHGATCSDYRPDKMYHDSFHNLVLHFECDENEHKGKNGDYSCDEKRISEIYDEFKESKIENYIVIRYNPDPFKKPDKYKKTRFTKEYRRDLLKKVINHIFEFESQHPILIIYMFYSPDSDRFSKNLPNIKIYSESDIKKYN